MRDRTDPGGEIAQSGRIFHAKRDIFRHGERIEKRKMLKDHSDFGPKLRKFFLISIIRNYIELRSEVAPRNFVEDDFARIWW